jgi:xylulokinase
MSATHLLGIDIGTQAVKAVLFDRQGRARAAATRRSQLLQPVPGVVEEDPERQFRSVCACMRACLAESGIAPRSVAAIGIDGQMAGLLGIGDDGRAVTPYDSWLDTRCAPYIEPMRAEAGAEVIRRTGGPPSFNHGPKILWWKHERPAVYRRIAAFVQPGAYAVMRLAGMDAGRAFIDKSYLHFSGFADNVQGVWDEALCRQFDVDRAKLPQIVASHAVVGELTAEAARRCGLAPGTPLVAGCGDTAASFLACGATREGVCVDVAGTASVFAATTRRFNADVAQGVLGWGQSATPGLWHPYAYVNGGGMNLEWFAREFGARGTGQRFKDLERQAARLQPQADDPLFLPHLGGRVSPSRPQLRGSWAGLNWSHTAGHLYRAVLEGVALEYCIYRDVLHTLNPELKSREVRITGGGQHSTLWNQIKADALGLTVVQIERQEGAPLGAALLAGFGVGLFESLDAAAQEWIVTGQRVRPQRRLGAHYAARLRRYQRLLELLDEWTTMN